MLLLDKIFYIDMNDSNVVLCKKVEFIAKKNTKYQVKGKKYIRISILGYYPNITFAINAYIELIMQQKIAENNILPTEFVLHVESIKKIISSLKTNKP